MRAGPSAQGKWKTNGLAQCFSAIEAIFLIVGFIPVGSGSCPLIPFSPEPCQQDRSSYGSSKGGWGTAFDSFTCFGDNFPTTELPLPALAWGHVPSPTLISYGVFSWYLCDLHFSKGKNRSIRSGVEKRRAGLQGIEGAETVVGM